MIFILKKIIINYIGNNNFFRRFKLGLNFGGYGNQLNQVSAYEQQASNIGSQSALLQAQTGANLAAISANGQAAQLSLQQINEQKTVEAEYANLALRADLETASRALETTTLIAQYREKTVQLMIQIQEARTANVWNRLKSLASGFKF